MIKLSDTIEIQTSPEALFDWFTHLPEHYLEWHPHHVVCRFEGSAAIRPGARLYAEEYLHGKLHKLSFRITRVFPLSRVDYRMAPGLRGAFVAEHTTAGTLFIAELEFGVDWPILGPLIDRLLMRTFSHRIEAVRQHMKEEGVNLKRILETARPASDLPPPR